jgi:hypothetical protein
VLPFIAVTKKVVGVFCARFRAPLFTINKAMIYQKKEYGIGYRNPFCHLEQISGIVFMMAVEQEYEQLVWLSRFSKTR